MGSRIRLRFGWVLPAGVSLVAPGIVVQGQIGGALILIGGISSITYSVVLLRDIGGAGTRQAIIGTEFWQRIFRARVINRPDARRSRLNSGIVWLIVGGSLSVIGIALFLGAIPRS